MQIRPMARGGFYINARDLDGKQTYWSFPTEEEAQQFANDLAEARSKRVARCGHEVPMHGGRQRRACDSCIPPSRPANIACEGCGAEVAVSMHPGPIPRWCSGRCRDWGREHPGVPTPSPGKCGHCDAPLDRLGKKYCSQRCGQIARGDLLPESYSVRMCALQECGAEFQPKSKRQRCCCEAHGKRLWKIEAQADGRLKREPWGDKRRDRYHRRRALKKAAATGDPVRFSEIAERDRWTCHLCAKRVNSTRVWPHPLSPSMDHVVPLSKGGTHEPANVRLAHLRCNLRKNNRGGGEQLLLIG